MSPAQRYALLMILLVLAAVTGIVVIVLLMAAWRRYLSRQKKHADKPTAAPPATDIWHVSGQRLQNQTDDKE